MDITSFIMGYNKGKQSASGGGGVSDDRVHYVTFMYGDTELYRMPVVNGDTCHDPVAKGYIETPTKESTVQYNYSYSGWSLTEGGTASSTALTNVTEDRTVYAAFTETVRKYTVSYYDGETVVHTEQIAYGGSSSYIYQKDNHLFEGWNPEPTNVTADLSCYGTWVESYTFAAASWEYIAQMSESGKASSVFFLGDKKVLPLTFPNGKTCDVEVQIVGFDHDDLADGSGKAGISIMTVPVVDWQSFDSSNPGVNYILNDGSYGNSQNAMKIFLESTVISYFPSACQNVIKQVTKEYATNKSGDLGTVNDRAWMPSVVEICGTDISGYISKDGDNYTYLSNANLRKKYLLDSSGLGTKAVSYYTRSKQSYGGYLPAQVDSYGEADYNVSVDGYAYFPIGFCI